MSVRVPLPACCDLPVGVYFHREHPSDKRIVLQIPNTDRTASETHAIDLDNHEHKKWMADLKNSHQLSSMLEYASHVAYDTKTGYCVTMVDLDAPSRGAELLAGARRSAGGKSLVDQMLVRRERRGDSTSHLAQMMQRSKR
jgi:hypothetical protein